MILGQVLTHANSLYHEWGIITAAAGLLVPLLGAVLWLLKLKAEQITQSVLSIRSGLASLMERTFHIEALKLIELIDDQLPSALSQVDADNPRPSAFDRLCLGLRDFDPNEPDRVQYRTLLEFAISGIITTQAKKLLGATAPTGLRFSFRYETERILAYIATQTNRSIRKQRAYDKATVWAKRFPIAALIAAGVATVWLFFDTTWSFYLNAICLSAFLAAVVAGCVALFIVAGCQAWITTRAEWRPEDWLDDLDRTRQTWQSM